MRSISSGVGVAFLIFTLESSILVTFASSHLT
jgi:hypothetical protein